MKRQSVWTVLALVAGLLTVSATKQSSAPDLDRVMRLKLACSQKVLEAMVTSHWVALERSGLDLQRLTEEPAWSVLKSPEYVRYTKAFYDSVGQLVDAAQRHDLDAAPRAYASMTMKCVDCHRYVARSRIAD